jgi:hypothetical protein
MTDIAPTPEQSGLMGLAAIGQMPIDEAEKVMLAQEQVECPVFNHFGPGVYMRETHFPKGTIAIGHAHKFAHTNVILKGRLAVIHPDGTATEYKAPAIFPGTPGRKAAYFFEDTAWMNIHATEETDMEKLEEIFIEKSEAYLNAQALKTIALLQSREDK